MSKYTVEHENIKVHFDTLWKASLYAKNLKSGRIIEHIVIYDFNPKSVKINKHNINLSE